MILVKEEFIGSEKWRHAVKLAGCDAIAMWLAMKCYCAKYPNTEGFVPDEDLDGLPGAPRRARRALEALLQCGRLLPDGGRGAGLVEAAEGGWRLHDYSDHSASPEEVELQREKAKLKKRRYRDDKRRELEEVRRQAGALGGGDMRGQAGGHMRDKRGDTGGDIDGDTGGDTRGDGPAGARPREGERARGPALARPHPNPPLSNPFKKSLLAGKQDPRARGRAQAPSPLADLVCGVPPPERAPAVVVGLEPCAEHRRFAADHGLDLERYVAEVRSDPDAAALTPAQAGARLAGRLMSAATDEGSITERAIGGAA